MRDAHRRRRLIRRRDPPHRALVGDHPIRAVARAHRHTARHRAEPRAGHSGQRLGHAAEGIPVGGKPRQRHRGLSRHDRPTAKILRDAADRHILFVRHHLEGQRRDAIAERLQRQILEHHIGKAAMGRCPADPFRARDQRIGLLRLVAVMQPEAGLHLPVVRRAAQQVPVRPDPPDTPHPTARYGDREGHRIAVARDARLPLAPAPLAAMLDEVG